MTTTTTKKKKKNIKDAIQLTIFASKQNKTTNQTKNNNTILKIHLKKRPRWSSPHQLCIDQSPWMSVVPFSQPSIDLNLSCVWLAGVWHGIMVSKKSLKMLLSPMALLQVFFFFFFFFCVCVFANFLSVNLSFFFFCFVHFWYMM